MARKLTLFVFCTAISQTISWAPVPEIPSGRRSQYYVLQDNGGYQYGYDTGKGLAAKQSGDSANEVSGQYIYTAPTGQHVDLKYTAGVKGFIPEGLDKLQALTAQSPSIPSGYGSSSDGSSADDQANTGDASYSFAIDTDTYKRKESSDSQGNVQGSYSYTNPAGVHDLTYIAGANTGFVATSGSLSVPNGLKQGQAAGPAAPSSGYSYPPPASTGGYSYPPPTSYLPPAPGSSGPSSSSSQINPDGSYSFSYSTKDSSQQQSADAANNVQGRYSYQNSAGTHDLSYVAGASTGFLPTGGSLSKPNGLPNSGSTPTWSAGAGAAGSGAVSGAGSASSSNIGTDGSYSFGFSTADQERSESSDASGNVKGKYSYKNQAGTHDLSYVAGASTGFLPTGGSLSVPNGLGGKSPSNPTAQLAPITNNYLPPNSGSGDSNDDQANTGDASYNFSFDTDEYKRQESSDASGNVKGSFSYKNSVGTHDLSFVAGSATGFLPTGGSLKTPPGLTEAQLNSGQGKSSTASFSGDKYLAPPANSLTPSTKTSYTLDGNVKVHTYLPPGNEKKKYGYILDTA